MLRALITSEISSSLLKKLFYVTVFFTFAPLVLLISLMSLLNFSKFEAHDAQVLAVNNFQNPGPGIQVFASLPSAYPSVSGEVVSEDARIELIRRFLESNNSPMLPHSKTIVEKSDIYEIDYRLTTAIAMKESGLGRLMPHDDCNNAWGWGIHSAGTLCFDSWEEGIETVTKGLREKYANLGLITPIQIMSKWVPHSPGGLWAEGVSYYMERIL